MKRLIATLLLLFAPATHAAASDDSKLQADLVRISMTLLDTITSGDKRPWQTLLTDDFVLVDRDGSIKRRQELVDGTSPLPKGYTIELRVVDPETHSMGNTALLIYRVIEEMTVFGQPIHVEYRTSKVFRKSGSDWKLASWQYVEIPKDPPPTKVEPAAYDPLLGEYFLTDEVRYVVTRRGDKLYGQRSGRSEHELVPESESVFYVPQTEWRKIFVRDASGRVTGILDRRKGTDLFWKRAEKK